MSRERGGGEKISEEAGGGGEIGGTSHVPLGAFACPDTNERNYYSQKFR